MSNRLFREKYVFGMEKDRKDIYARVTIGAVGAPTLDVPNSKGVASITRTSAGLYVITMGTPASSQAIGIDKYKKILGVDVVFDTSGAGGASPAAPGMFMKANTITTTATITIQFTNISGVATDPASGEVALLNFVFGDSNV